MKNRILLIVTIFMSFLSFSQNDSGGGEFVVEETVDKCLSQEDRDAIQMRLRENIHRLSEEGKLEFTQDREDVKFSWPMQKAADLNWNSYFGISGFVDQDGTAGIENYNCDNRTYNGHMGTDYFTWPFPWHLYENDLVEVIAGEEGIIIEKDDGFDDDHCECFGSWNAIYVQHADGSVAWYGHLKEGSLTDKVIGDAVVAGEYLGVVASSGCSTGPHLHLEVYDAEVNLIDPYAGACNDLNTESWWEDQPENREPTLNTLLTHSEIPEMGCPSVNEDPHLSNDFYVGDELFTAFYYHDALAGSAATCRIKMPDGTVWQEWTNSIGVTFNASWWWWNWDLPEVGPFGVWTLEAVYEGVTSVHEFNYGVYANLEEDLSAKEITLAPNPSNGIFIITGVNSNSNIEVYDAQGKKIKAFVLTTNTIDLSNLSQGIYYLKLSELEGVRTKKFVIN